MNDYDLWMDVWVILNIEVSTIHHHLRDYPMVINSWYNDYFVTKSILPSSYITIKKIKTIYTNSSLASKWPDLPECDPLNTILGSDIGLEKCRSRQTDNKSEDLMNKYCWQSEQLKWTKEFNKINELHANNKYLQWMMKLITDHLKIWDKSVDF